MTAAERKRRRRLAYHLRAAMRSAWGVPMVWGRDDCILFQADIHLAATGLDPAADFRGRYRTRLGAIRLLGRQGVAGALRLAARHFGWRRVSPASARIGDVGLVMLPSGASAVRKLHRGEWIGRNESAWSVVATKDVRAAWSVC